MKRLSLLLAATICLAAIASSARAEDDWVRSVTVRTNHTSPDPVLKNTSRHWCGSGTIVHRDEKSFFVLTCRHNFANDAGELVDGETTVHLDDGTKYPATIAATSSYHRDLALLRIDTKDRVKTAALASEATYKVGEPYVACGYPGWKRAVRRGKQLDWYTTNKGGFESFASSIEAAPGISGAGVFREKDMKLVGVLRGGGRETGGAISVRLSDVHDWLASVSRGKEKRLALAAWLK